MNINDLPQEILSPIFAFSARKTSIGGNPVYLTETLDAIALVSKSWRDICSHSKEELNPYCILFRKQFSKHADFNIDFYSPRQRYMKIVNSSLGNSYNAIKIALKCDYELFLLSNLDRAQKIEHYHACWDGEEIARESGGDGLSLYACDFVSPLGMAIRNSAKECIKLLLEDERTRCDAIGRMDDRIQLSPIEYLINEQCLNDVEKFPMNILKALLASPRVPLKFLFMAENLLSRILSECAELFAQKSNEELIKFYEQNIRPNKNIEVHDSFATIIRSIGDIRLGLFYYHILSSVKDPSIVGPLSRMSPFQAEQMMDMVIQYHNTQLFECFIDSLDIRTAKTCMNKLIIKSASTEGYLSLFEKIFSRQDFEQVDKIKFYNGLIGLLRTEKPFKDAVFAIFKKHMVGSVKRPLEVTPNPEIVEPAKKKPRTDNT